MTEENKFKYCLVQVFDWESQEGENKKLLECKDCVLKDVCNKKEKSVSE